MAKPVAHTLLLVLVLGAVGAYAFFHYGRSLWHPLFLKLRGTHTVADVIEHYGPAATHRLETIFSQVNVGYPPSKITLLGMKAERSLELWAREQDKWLFITNYPIKGASGRAGPKLREGDRQVPEGIYRIIGLNPNSSYRLSLKLDYPNAFDRKQLRQRVAPTREAPFLSMANPFRWAVWPWATRPLRSFSCSWPQLARRMPR